MNEIVLTKYPGPSRKTLRCNGRRQGLLQHQRHFAEIPRLLYALILRGLYVGWEPAILTFPRDRQLETTRF
jgi:hypothetical protein